MPPATPLSVVLITRNAATQLAACLQSVAFADDIVIVDSGSTDATKAIATRFNARFIQHEWLGFGQQKQLAVSHALHPWVLCLDADERVSDDLQKCILATLTKPTHHVYRMARCNRFLGRYLRYGEGYPDWNVRLFHRDYARWSDDVVHEHVLSKAPIASLNGDLWHDSAETLASYLTKQNRYTTLAADAAFAAGKRSHVAQLIFSPLFRFGKFYIIRRGVLDGLPGLIHILIGCFNSFMKYAKLIEQQNRQNGGIS